MDYRRVAYRTAGLGLVLLALAGCAISVFGYDRRAEWHDAEETACTRARVVRVSAYVQPVREIKQRVCGIDRPLRVSAMGDGTVSIGPTATINCPMTNMVDRWLGEAVQPAALAWYGSRVVEIKQISAYACRPKNNEAGESLSEHAYGNALDVAGFRLADGRMITVKNDWNGDPYARGFLREIFAAACERFKTVLGPGVKYHGDHFHLDLAHHNKLGTSRYCNPMPDGPPPRRAPYTPGLFVQRGNFDFTRTGSIGTSDAPVNEGIGELLTEMPQDVIDAEMSGPDEPSDPFAALDLRTGAN